jgi:UDP-GlcNAc:undecaprenyl-phosphate GlcNAc-1-phosphate transferase
LGISSFVIFECESPLDLQTITLFVAATLLPSLLISWVAGFAARRYAPRWGLVDRPGQRKVHAQATPLGGGLAIWLAVLVLFTLGTLVLFVIRTDAAATAPAASPAPAPNDWPLWGLVLEHVRGLKHRLPDLWVLLGAATVLMVLGLADDRRGFDWRLRLAVQTVVAAIVVLWRGWQASAFVDIPPFMAGAVESVRV